MKSRLPPALLAAFFFAFAPLAHASLNVSHYPDPSTLPGKGPTNVWSGLANLWANRHAQWANNAAPRHAIVFLGDSITQGFEPLSRYFPHMKVVNRGIGGDTTRGVLYRIEPDVLALHPDAVVLLIGTNDLGLGADPDDVFDNIKQIVARIRSARPRARIILCNVMPRNDGHVNRAPIIKKFNASLQQFASENPKLAFCDTWSLYADAEGNCSQAEFPDLLHPNAGGYEKWAAALLPIFQHLNLTR